MKIFDCFTFHNELALLKIRCEELKGLEVTHVLVEATRTFTGKDKPLTFFQNRESFSEYNIHHFVSDTLVENGNPWDNETSQRDYILEALLILGAKDEDLVMISDADEIPRKEALEKYVPNDDLTAIIMDKFGYYLNCMECRQGWERARIMKVSHLK